MSDPLYGILFPHQKAQISVWCWGKCGHGQMGAIDIGPAHVIVCQQADCPHLDKQMGEPMGDVDGRPLFLRKLRDIESEQIDAENPETPKGGPRYSDAAPVGCHKSSNKTE